MSIERCADLLGVDSGPALTMLHEGLTLEAKRDSRGWFIGRGHNSPDVCEGLVWTLERANYQFNAVDYPTAQLGLIELLKANNVIGLDDVRSAALCDMIFEMGKSGVAEFVQMWSALGRSLWLAAGVHAMQSLWAKQVPQRALIDVQLLRLGRWPNDWTAGEWDFNG